MPGDHNMFTLTILKIVLFFYIGKFSLNPVIFLSNLITYDSLNSALDYLYVRVAKLHATSIEHVHVVGVTNRYILYVTMTTMLTTAYILQYIISILLWTPVVLVGPHIYCLYIITITVFINLVGRGVNDVISRFCRAVMPKTETSDIRMAIIDVLGYDWGLPLSLAYIQSVIVALVRRRCAYVETGNSREIARKIRQWIRSHDRIARLFWSKMRRADIKITKFFTLYALAEIMPYSVQPFMGIILGSLSLIIMLTPIIYVYGPARVIKNIRALIMYNPVGIISRILVMIFNTNVVVILLITEFSEIIDTAYTRAILYKCVGGITKIIRIKHQKYALAVSVFTFYGISFTHASAKMCIMLLLVCWYAILLSCVKRRIYGNIKLLWINKSLQYYLSSIYILHSSVCVFGMLSAYNITHMITVVVTAAALIAIVKSSDNEFATDKSKTNDDNINANNQSSVHSSMDGQLSLNADPPDGNIIEDIDSDNDDEIIMKRVPSLLDAQHDYFDQRIVVPITHSSVSPLMLDEDYFGGLDESMVTSYMASAHKN